MGGLHTPELIIILAVALLLFGPKNLPKLGKAIGKTAKSFREGMESDEKDATTDDELIVEAEEVKTPECTEEVVFCNSCGQKNPKHASFCNKCGSKLVDND